MGSIRPQDDPLQATAFLLRLEAAERELQAETDQLERRGRRRVAYSTVMAAAKPHYKDSRTVEDVRALYVFSEQQRVMIAAIKSVKKSRFSANDLHAYLEPGGDGRYRTYQTRDGEYRTFHPNAIGGVLSGLVSEGYLRKVGETRLTQSVRNSHVKGGVYERTRKWFVDIEGGSE